MAKKQINPDKVMAEATVESNRQIGYDFYKLTITFEGPPAKTFANTQPGQFVELDLSTASTPSTENTPEKLRNGSERLVLLRRPFSFCDLTCESDKTSAEILYRVIGPGTLRMSNLSAGDYLSVIGPLGIGFSVPAGKKTAVLVTGGMGAGPMEHLAKVLAQKHNDIKVTAFAGAKSRDQLPFENVSQSLREFTRYGTESFIATDDGSAGEKGFVTDCMADWLDKNSLPTEEMIIYSCGPEPMLAKVSQIAGQHNIDCQVSMERMMACGIGLCQGCAVECRAADSTETVYKMCCKEGPVFDSKEVVFS
ncbi:dihydroorotate dehydrogenase electron transfer subunit [Planctomycetota bacterium]